MPRRRHAVAIDRPRGILIGASDPRKDVCALVIELTLSYPAALPIPPCNGTSCRLNFSSLFIGPG